MNAEHNAAARQRLLVVIARMLEALYEQTAVPVLATLKPSDMRPGGARVPGTSYELPANTAARVMRELLALQGGRADGLLTALAEADVTARYAALTGKQPPVLGSLYGLCTPDLDTEGTDSFTAALKRLYVAAERIFTVTQMRRIDLQCYEWSEKPEQFDWVPVQTFVARWVRNAP